MRKLWPKHPFQRRTLVVNKKVQWTLVAFGVIMMLCSSIFTAVFVFLQNSELNTDIGVTVILVVFLGLIQFTLLILWSLVLSNQICGPVYRVHQEIKAVLNGSELKPINLRKNDFFQPLIDDFNEAMKKWNRS